MRYEGNVFRPPSEARSLIIQVTIGCAHNDCTFCSMYKDKKFRIRNLNEVLEDLASARKYYRNVRRIFLADGDALVLKTKSLVKILEYIKESFPECERVGIYASPHDILRKTDQELKLLYEKGLKIAYLGVESGSERILEAIKKGVTPEEMVEAGKKINNSGIELSMTLISGLGGKKNWKEHAVKSGEITSKINPKYVGLLTLMLEPGTELYMEVKEERFSLLSANEVLLETEEMIKNIKGVSDCVFRSNHASNYLSLKGTLPEDKERLLKEIELAKQNSGMLKDERFRML